MKTILHITECLGSGVLNYVKNLCKWQVKEYRVVVAYSTRPETPDDFKKQFDEKVDFIKVNGFTREIEPKNDLAAFFDLKRIVKKVEPNLIHLHSTKAGIIGRWAINCRNNIVLYSPHAYSFLMMDCSYFKRKTYAFIERISDRRECITVADAYGELEASRSVTKHAICIPNGINPDEIDELVSHIEVTKEPNIRVTVCILGKIVPQKNPQLFNAIAEKMPEYDFLWIGAGPLEHLLVSQNISVTGWMTREAAIKRIISSDIFLFTSIWESLSIALMEAMYLEKPCVVSKCDGNMDVITNGVNGYLCENVDEYVGAIKKMAENKALAESFGKKAKNEIIENHNVKLIEGSYRQLFNTLGL